MRLTQKFGYNPLKQSSSNGVRKSSPHELGSGYYWNNNREVDFNMKKGLIIIVFFTCVVTIMLLGMLGYSSELILKLSQWFLAITGGYLLKVFYDWMLKGDS